MGASFDELLDRAYYAGARLEWGTVQTYGGKTKQVKLTMPDGDKIRCGVTLDDAARLLLSELDIVPQA